jgi:hypothetical protein
VLMARLGGFHTVSTGAHAQDDVHNLFELHVGYMRPVPAPSTQVVAHPFRFGRSEKTVCRQLVQVAEPKRCTRKAEGPARSPVEREFRRWSEMVAALKLATLHRQGRHLSTAKAITLAEDGVDLEGRYEHIPTGVRTGSCCDRVDGHARDDATATPAARAPRALRGAREPGVLAVRCVDLRDPLEGKGGTLLSDRAGALRDALSLL